MRVVLVFRRHQKPVGIEGSGKTPGATREIHCTPPHWPFKLSFLQKQKPRNMFFFGADGDLFNKTALQPIAGVMGPFKRSLKDTQERELRRGRVAQGSLGANATPTFNHLRLRGGLGPASRMVKVERNAKEAGIWVNNDNLVGVPNPSKRLCYE